MKRALRWGCVLAVLAVLLGAGYVALSGVSKTSHAPLPLTPTTAPEADCAIELHADQNNALGEPLQVLELHCSRREGIVLHVGPAWYELPGTMTPEAHLNSTPDKKRWLLEAALHLFLSEDGGHTFVQLQPPGSDEPTLYVVTRAEGADGFQELTLDTSQQAPKTMHERLASARLAWGYDPKAPLRKRLDDAVESLTHQPPNGAFQVISHDGGRSWVRTLIDSGISPASGTTDLNTPF